MKFQLNKIGKLFTAMLLLAVLSTGTFFGCFISFDKLSKLEFNVVKISMNLGDEIDLYDYLTIKPQNSFTSIEITSGDDSIVSSSMNLTALSVGRTNIKASGGGKEAFCNVEVSYKEAKSLQVFSYGSLLQWSNDTQSVDFVAVVDEYIDPDYIVNWYVNDTEQQLTGNNFSYTPQTFGTYTIRATIKNTNISDSLTAMVYAPTQSIQPLNVTDLANGVQFSSNTPGYWEFFVNGENVYSIGGTADFTFQPEIAGIYSITATLCGQPIMLSSGDTECIFIKKGSIKPENLVFEYDNCYPDSYIMWELPNVCDLSGFEYQVDITNKNGTVRTYTSQTHSSLFDGTTFNSSSEIDITEQYTIAVSCFEGTNFTNGEKATLNTKPISSSALSYLTKKYLDKNYYIMSDSEFFDIYEYTLWMRRDKAVSKGETSTTMKVYMAYTSEYNSSRLSRMAWARSAQSGIYYLDEPTGATSEGSTLTVKITYDGDNSPTKNTSDMISVTDERETLLKPHVNYSGKTDRALAIDEKPLADDIVSTSNELYYIVENGFRPNIKSGSVAQTLYNYARDILKEIIIDEMDELEKIHAIYDWIMWRTHYDETVVQIINLKEAVKYDAYYLESVLTDVYPYSVCDGISKAFSLLVNMEGIKCVRIVGVADGGNNWTAHAWNKVYYQDEWYLVDCTWGDNKASVEGQIFELASHRYFMVSSDEMSMSHREKKFVEYPKTAVRPLLFLNNPLANGDTSTKLYFADADDNQMENRATALVDYLLATKSDTTSYTIGSDDNITVEKYYGVEFFVSSNLLFRVKSKIELALMSRNVQNAIIIDITGGYIYLLIKY